MFGESSLKNNMKRIGTAIALEDTVCSVIGRKDIEKILGSNIQNLIFYSTKKWAVMRLKLIHDYTSAEIDRIIMSFDTLMADKQQKIDSSHNGLVISLEGTINGKPEGELFNGDGIGFPGYQCEPLVKDDAGYYAYLSFAKLE